MAEVSLDFSTFQPVKKSLGKVKFNRPEIEEGFEKLAPEMQQVVESSPAPLTMSSGYRDPAHNAKVGGVPNSQHIQGKAFDALVDENTPALQKYYQGLGLKSFVHDAGSGSHLHTEGTPKNLPVSLDFGTFEPLNVSREPSFIEEVTSNIQKNPFQALNPLLAVPGVSTFLRKGAQSATAGLSEPAASGISSMIDRDLQKGGYTPERPIGESYNYFKDKQVQSLAEQEAQNPNAALAGDIVGLVSPLGALSTAYKGANTGVNFLGKGIEKVAPALTKLPGLIKGIGKAGLRGALTNEAYQGVRGLVDPSNAQSTGEALLTGAAGDIVGTGLAKGIGKGISALANKTNETASRQMNSIIGTPLKDLKRGKNLGKELIERDIFGSEKKLQKLAEEGLSKYEGKLDDALKSVNKNIDIKKVIGELDDLKTHYVNTPGSANEVKAIDDLITEIQTSPRFRDVTPSEANKIKRSLYKKVNTGYDRDVVSLKKEMDKVTARGYKKSIEDSVPEVAGINKELSVYGRLQDAMENVLAKQEKAPRKAISLRDLPALTTGGLVGGAPGAAVAYGLDRAVTGTLGKTAAALGLSKASKVLNKISGVAPKGMPESVKPKLLQLLPQAAGDQALSKLRPPKVADAPIPESSETLALQMDALQNGRSKALLVTPGAKTPSVPKRFKTLQTSVGTWVYDPLRIKPKSIEEKIANGTHGELLGHVEPKSLKATKVITAMKDGVEAKTSLVSPKNLNKQRKILQKQFPDADIQVQDHEQAANTIIKERLMKLESRKRAFA